MFIREEFGTELHGVIREKLVEFNNGYFKEIIGNLDEESIGYYLYEEEDVVGGITGRFYGNTLHVDFFWISENLRGLGQGSKLLDKMIEFARKNQCTIIYLETFSFQAPNFYLKNGFEIFAEFKNSPIENTTTYFLKKQLI